MKSEVLMLGLQIFGRVLALFLSGSFRRMGEFWNQNMLKLIEADDEGRELTDEEQRAITANIERETAPVANLDIDGDGSPG